jgi:hypothetical protein
MTWRQTEDADLFEVVFSPEDVGEWCLALVLLLEGLAEALKVDSRRKGPELKIAIDKRLPRAHRARIEGCNNEVVAMCVTRTEAEAWLCFFLECYRDGTAAVDHVDLDIVRRGPIGQRDFRMTLYAPAAKPPMSAEELKRKLGL